MTNNSPVYWTANGLSLHTMAWSVKSFGGKRWTGPAKRGEDIKVPFRRGRIRARKSRESRYYDINMWVIPTNEDGGKPTDRVQQAHANWRQIVAAVDIEDQFDLVKRWYEGSEIVSATARAEYVDGSGPGADDGTGFDFQMTLMLADPYFYRPIASQPVGNVVIEGDVPTDHFVVTFTGGTNPRLTLPGGNWIQYNGAVGATPVVINMLTGMAKRGSSYVNGLIVRNQAFSEWPMLEPGAQNLALSGGGTAAFIYDAAYR